MTFAVEVPDTHHLYECSEGHEFSVDPARSPKPVKRCPVYHLGSPCKGTLSRYGKGARQANAR